MPECDTLCSLPNYQSGKTNLSEMRCGPAIDLFIHSTSSPFPQHLMALCVLSPISDMPQQGKNRAVHWRHKGPSEAIISRPRLLSLCLLKACIMCSIFIPVRWINPMDWRCTSIWIHMDVEIIKAWKCLPSLSSLIICGGWKAPPKQLEHMFDLFREKKEFTVTDYWPR